MAHTAEEKIKILYEDSLRDIRQLTERLEAAVKILASTKSAISSSTEHQLAQSIIQIEKLADSISTNKSGIEKAACSVVKSLLLGDDGPIKKLNDLFVLYQYNTRQNSAWMAVVNEATGKVFVAVMILCGILGGVVSGIILKFL